MSSRPCRRICASLIHTPLSFATALAQPSMADGLNMLASSSIHLARRGLASSQCQPHLQHTVQLQAREFYQALADSIYCREQFCRTVSRGCGTAAAFETGKAEGSLGQNTGQWSAERSQSACDALVKGIHRRPH